MTNSCATMSVARAAEFLEVLRARGLPVTGVSEPVEAGQMLAGVAVKAAPVRARRDI